MARKANSSKPPGPKTGFRPSFERAKPPTKPPKAAAAADPGTSAQQGMLQLTFARHAHGYGFLAAIAFFFNGVLLVTFAGRPLPITGLRLDYVLWLLPAVAGALTSWDAVRLKREPYRRHYVSRHFATSAAHGPVLRRRDRDHRGDAGKPASLGHPADLPDLRRGSAPDDHLDGAHVAGTRRAEARQPRGRVDHARPDGLPHPVLGQLHSRNGERPGVVHHHLPDRRPHDGDRGIPPAHHRVVDL